MFVTTVVGTGEVELPKPGLYFGGERPTPTTEYRWMLYALDFATGAVRWEREVHRGIPQGPKHVKNSYGSETPVTDGERIYVLFGGVGLFAFFMDGGPAWTYPLTPATTRYGWGTAQSPALHENRVYVLNDNETQSFLASVDTQTGREV